MTHSKKRRIPLILSGIVIIVIAAVLAIIFKKPHIETRKIYENAVMNTANLPFMIEYSDLIVRCKVVSTGEPFQDDSISVYTPVTLQISEVYKGNSSNQSITIWEPYGVVDNTLWLYYPENCKQIPMKTNDDLILILTKNTNGLEPDYYLAYYGSFASVTGDTVTLNPCISGVKYLPGIGDDLTMPLSEFEALIADNL